MVLVNLPNRIVKGVVGYLIGRKVQKEYKQHTGRIKQAVDSR